MASEEQQKHPEVAAKEEEMAEEEDTAAALKEMTKNGNECGDNGVSNGKDANGNSGSQNGRVDHETENNFNADKESGDSGGVASSPRVRSPDSLVIRLDVHSFNTPTLPTSWSRPSTPSKSENYFIDQPHSAAEKIQDRICDERPRVNNNSAENIEAKNTTTNEEYMKAPNGQTNLPADTARDEFSNEAAAKKSKVISFEIKESSDIPTNLCSNSDSAKFSIYQTKPVAVEVQEKVSCEQAAEKCTSFENETRYSPSSVESAKVSNDQTKSTVKEVQEKGSKSESCNIIPTSEESAQVSNDQTKSTVKEVQEKGSDEQAEDKSKSCNIKDIPTSEESAQVSNDQTKSSVKEVQEKGSDEQAEDTSESCNIRDIPTSEESAQVSNHQTKSIVKEVQEKGSDEQAENTSESCNIKDIPTSEESARVSNDQTKSSVKEVQEKGSDEQAEDKSKYCNIKDTPTSEESAQVSNDQIKSTVKDVQEKRSDKQEEDTSESCDIKDIPTSEESAQVSYDQKMSAVEEVQEICGKPAEEKGDSKTTIDTPTSQKLEVLSTDQKYFLVVHEEKGNKSSCSKEEGTPMGKEPVAASDENLVVQENISSEVMEKKMKSCEGPSVNEMSGHEDETNSTTAVGVVSEQISVQSQITLEEEGPRHISAPSAQSISDAAATADISSGNRSQSENNDDSTTRNIPSPSSAAAEGSKFIRSMVADAVKTAKDKIAAAAAAADSDSGEKLKAAVEKSKSAQKDLLDPAGNETLAEKVVDTEMDNLMSSEKAPGPTEASVREMETPEQDLNNEGMDQGQSLIDQDWDTMDTNGKEMGQGQSLLDQDWENLDTNSQEMDHGESLLDQDWETLDTNEDLTSGGGGVAETTNNEGQDDLHLKQNEFNSVVNTPGTECQKETSVEKVGEIQLTAGAENIPSDNSTPPVAAATPIEIVEQAPTPEPLDNVKDQTALVQAGAGQDEEVEEESSAKSASEMNASSKVDENSPLRTEAAETDIVKKLNEEITTESIPDQVVMASGPHEESSIVASNSQNAESNQGASETITKSVPTSINWKYSLTSAPQKESSVDEVANSSMTEKTGSDMAKKMEVSITTMTTPSSESKDTRGVDQTSGDQEDLVPEVVTGRLEVSVKEDENVVYMKEVVNSANQLLQNIQELAKEKMELEQESVAANVVVASLTLTDNKVTENIFVQKDKTHGITEPDSGMNIQQIPPYISVISTEEKNQTAEAIEVLDEIAEESESNTNCEPDIGNISTEETSVQVPISISMHIRDNSIEETLTVVIQEDLSQAENVPDSKETDVGPAPNVSEEKSQLSEAVSVPEPEHVPIIETAMDLTTQVQEGLLDATAAFVGDTDKEHQSKDVVDGADLTASSQENYAQDFSDQSPMLFQSEPQTAGQVLATAPTNSSQKEELRENAELNKSSLPDVDKDDLQEPPKSTTACTVQLQAHPVQVKHSQAPEQETLPCVGEETEIAASIQISMSSSFTDNSSILDPLARSAHEWDTEPGSSSQAVPVKEVVGTDQKPADNWAAFGNQEQVTAAKTEELFSQPEFGQDDPWGGLPEPTPQMSQPEKEILVIAVTNQPNSAFAAAITTSANGGTTGTVTTSASEMPTQLETTSTVSKVAISQPEVILSATEARFTSNVTITEQPGLTMAKPPSPRVPVRKAPKAPPGKGAVVESPELSPPPRKVSVKTAAEPAPMAKPRKSTLDRRPKPKEDEGQSVMAYLFGACLCCIAKK